MFEYATGLVFTWGIQKLVDNVELQELVSSDTLALDKG